MERLQIFAVEVILVGAAAPEEEPRGTRLGLWGVNPRRLDHRAPALEEAAEGRDARAGTDHDHRVGHVGRRFEVRGFLDVQRDPEVFRGDAAVQPVGRDALPLRAARSRKLDDGERHGRHAAVRLGRGRDAVHPGLEGLERVEELGPAGLTRRVRPQQVEQRGALVAAPSLVLVASTLGAQRQEVAALPRVGARLREHAKQGLTRLARHVHGVSERVLHGCRAPNVPQRSPAVSRRSLTLGPHQLEHRSGVQSEPARQRVDRRGVVRR